MFIILYYKPDGSAASLSTSDGTPSSIASMCHEIVVSGCRIVDFYTSLEELETGLIHHGFTVISGPKPFDPVNEILG